MENILQALFYIMKNQNQANYLREAKQSNPIKPRKMRP